jgi:hypothetical protein
VTCPNINLELRYLVAKRADYLCEYCLISETNWSLSYEVNQIISVKHGGLTTEDNLTYACAYCNLYKGSDICSIIWRTGKLVRFFNPRRDFWGEHFRLDEVVIQPLTDIGEVTVHIFAFNSEDRILERQALIEVGRYPSTAAQQRMKK